jgi:predicted permease
MSAEDRLHKELRFHLEAHTADLIAQGCDPEEAKRLARLELGGLDQVAEQCRDVGRLRWFDDFARDLRYALRGLRRQPAFAIVAMCTLALGIGATTAVFTVVNGVLLKPLPYADPQKLVVLQEQTDWSTAFGSEWAFAYPNYLDCRSDSRSLALAAWRGNGGTLSAPGDPEYINTRQISANLLAVLGVPVASGRAFVDEDDRAGAAPVAIISDALWRRRFGGAPSAIGTTIVFDGRTHTIVGVASPDFQVDGDADLYTPLGQDAAPAMRNRDVHPRIQVWARLQPGASMDDARSELSVIARRLELQYPATNRGRSFVAQTLEPDVGSVRATLWLLLAAVSLVLAVACANVAGLLLARAAARERELAMRSALGASRGRLIRQALTESAVLGLAGGIAGVVLAPLGVRSFVAFWPGSLPRADEVQIDWRVLLFAVAISLVSSFAFGLAPAWRAAARDLEPTLRATSRGAGGSRRIHGALVVSELALAIVLLVSAGALGRTLIRLSSLDPGVDIANTLVARMALSPAALASPDRARAAWDDVIVRARQVPGVASIALVDTVPLRDGNNQLGYWPAADLPPANRMPLALATMVTPEYLGVTRLPLRRGRFFTSRDTATAAPVIVVDDVLARRAFGDGDAIGRHLWIPDMGPAAFEIVGVVGHVRYWGLAGDDQAAVRAQFYYPFAQLPDRFVRRWSTLMSIAVRTTTPPLTIVETLRRQLRGSSGDQVLYAVRTFEQLARDTLATQRFLWMLFSAFAALALLLACIGIYGVLAYLTSRRVPEIGVRLTLGATARDIKRMIVGQSLRMIGPGVLLGAVAAFGAGRVLEYLVEGVQPTQPSTFIVMVAALLASALLAAFIPARRASRIDAMTALREE